MRVFSKFVAALFGLTATALCAQTVPPEVAGRLIQIVPGLETSDIAATPVPGLYEVVVQGQVAYLTGDGRYMMRGEMIDLERRTNITESRRRTARLGVLEAEPVDDMIVFAPASPEEVRHTVTVFTDVDCGYCAKLHRQIADYNQLGISVRYMAFPRAGIGSSSYDKIVSVWCAEDQRQAMTRAKARQPVESRSCENPVRRHFAAGRAIGVTGTPTIVLEDGSVVPGYVEPKQLLGYLTEGG